MKRSLPVAALLALACFTARGDDAHPKKTPLDERIQSVLPGADEEKWLKVAWVSDLARGRFEANAARKPIFLWLMNGDPLGCT